MMLTMTMNQIIIMNQNILISLWSDYFLKINRITGIIRIFLQLAPHPFAVKSESTYGGRGVSIGHSVTFVSFGMLWEEWPESPAWHKIMMILMDWLSKLIFMLHMAIVSFPNLTAAVFEESDASRRRRWRLLRPRWHLAISDYKTYGLIYGTIYQHINTYIYIYIW